MGLLMRQIVYGKEQPSSLLYLTCKLHLLERGLQVAKIGPGDHELRIFILFANKTFL